MSDQSTQRGKALAKPEPRALANDDPILEEARKFARRLKYMIVNGNKLSDQEVYALAHYCASNQLNPFAQEAYYMPGTGPVTGIVGFRRKAQEALMAEVNQWSVMGIKFDGPQNYWLEKRAATHDEAMFMDGDIAIHVTLHDSMARKQWQKSLFAAMKEIRDAGCSDFMECKKIAEEMIGPEPVWTGVGVVSQGEKFSRDGSPEKYNRVERAEKRAEKQALKKRFPSLQQYDTAPGENAIDVDAVDVSFSVEEEAEEQKQLSDKTPDDIIREMGCFDVGKKPDKPAADPVSPSAAAPETQFAGITLADAMNTLNSEGVRYGDIPVATLTMMRDSLAKRSDLTDDQLWSLEACKTIIANAADQPALI